MTCSGYAEILIYNGIRRFSWKSMNGMRGQWSTHADILTG